MTPLFMRQRIKALESELTALQAEAKLTRREWLGGRDTGHLSLSEAAGVVMKKSQDDAMRYRMATRLADDAEALYTIVVNNEGDQAAIDAEFDEYWMFGDKSKAATE